MAKANAGDHESFGSEKMNTKIITLTRFLTEEQSKHKEATGDFTYVRSLQSHNPEIQGIGAAALTKRDRLLCHALQFSFKSIAYYIRRATLINVD